MILTHLALFSFFDGASATVVEAPTVRPLITILTVHRIQDAHG